MKKQVYSTPKTRLVTMSENVAIMATSGGSGSGSGSPVGGITIGGNGGLSGGGSGGIVIGGDGPALTHGYSGRFSDFN